MKKKLIIALVSIILIPFVAILSFNFILQLSAPLQIEKPYLIKINDMDGKPVYSHHFEGFGDYTPLEEISDSAKQAIIVSEDKNFYNHHGFDYKRIISSFFRNIIKGHIVSGGSTISQQYARTLYLNNDKTLKRKINEAIITKKLESSLSKDEILEGYLNSAYFGHNIYGITQASHFFYNKKPKDLTYAESSLLIGILSAPNLYSPINNYELAMTKKNQVLKLLKNNNYIDERQFEESINEKLNFYFRKQEPECAHHLLYFHDALMEELNKLEFGDDNYLRKSLNIKSTINWEMMKKISQIIDNYSINSDEEEIAVVVMKPNSGDILALIGGSDYNLSSFNRATKAKRQTGSAIKPLLYYLALQYGLSPLTQMKSEPTDFFIEGIGTYSPHNASELYAYRDINMVEAIANSDNIYATKTTLLIGSKKLQEALQLFGIDDALGNPTIGLGTNSLTPLKLAEIYNTFASLGKHYTPTLIKEISTGYNEKYTAKSHSNFSLNETNTLILNYLLRSPFDDALSTYATPSLAKYKTKKRFAAKTGSTSSDSWVAGYNPNYTIVVYVGNDNNEELKKGYLAKKIFVDICDSITSKDQDIFFTPNKMMHPFTMTNASNNSKSYVYYY